MSHKRNLRREGARLWRSSYVWLRPLGAAREAICVLTWLASLVKLI